MKAKFVTLVAAAVALAGLYTAACGNNNSYSTPTTPSPTGGGGGGATVTISIVGMNGAQSFSPNPATLPAGQMIVWHNVDSTTHHVVLDDGSLDTGDLRPGAFSQPMEVRAGGGPYHCSIHPVMVGAVKQGQ